MRRWVCGLLLPLCVLAPAAAVAKDTGLIFVSNEKTNNIIVIDPKTDKVVNDIEVSRRPRDMHFNADHTKLYVACGDDDVIDILDVASLKVVGKLVTGPREVVHPDVNVPGVQKTFETGAKNPELLHALGQIRGE